MLYTTNFNFRRSEALLKMVISQVACFYGPGAVQSIFQAIKSRTGEQLNAQPPEFQSYQPQPSINQPTFVNSQPQLKNHSEPIPYYQVIRITSIHFRPYMK